MLRVEIVNPPKTAAETASRAAAIQLAIDNMAREDLELAAAAGSSKQAVPSAEAGLSTQGVADVAEGSSSEAVPVAPVDVADADSTGLEGSATDADGAVSTPSEYPSSRVHTDEIRSDTSMFSEGEYPYSPTQSEIDAAAFEEYNRQLSERAEFEHLIDVWEDMA